MKKVNVKYSIRNTIPGRGVDYFAIFALIYDKDKKTRMEEQGYKIEIEPGVFKKYITKEGRKLNLVKIERGKDKEIRLRVYLPDNYKGGQYFVRWVSAFFGGKDKVYWKYAGEWWIPLSIIQNGQARATPAQLLTELGPEEQAMATEYQSVVGQLNSLMGYFNSLKDSLKEIDAATADAKRLGGVFRKGALLEGEKTDPKFLQAEHQVINFKEGLKRIETVANQIDRVIAEEESTWQRFQNMETSDPNLKALLTSLKERTNIRNLQTKIAKKLYFEPIRKAYKKITDSIEGIETQLRKTGDVETRFKIIETALDTIKSQLKNAEYNLTLGIEKLTTFYDATLQDVKAISSVEMERAA